MNCDAFELPTKNGVAKACERFDSQNKITEEALTDLFAKYQSNANEAQVLLKVVTLNDLYSTRLPLNDADRPNVFDVAKCIPKLNVDQAFREGSLKIVDNISTKQFPPKRSIKRFAFATKYASWHRQDLYPIWDRNVQNYLTCLRRLHRSDWNTFSEGFKLSGNWGYPEFHALMVRFQSHYGLETFSFKDLDKFLWLHGNP